jgi:hypothetical protein
VATDAIKQLTAQGLYKAVVTELDKTNVPSWSIEQFNYYGNRASLDLFNDLYDLYERTQTLTDALRSMLSYFTYTPVSVPPLMPAGQVMALPEDYKHALKATVTFMPTRAFSCFKQGVSFQRIAKRITADTQGFIEAPNHYLRATYDNVYHRVVAGQLKIYSGRHSALLLQQVDFEYFRVPPSVLLYDSDVNDLTVDNSQQLLWNADQSYELARYMVKAFMEQHGNQRLGNYNAMNQPNVGAPPSAPPPQRASQTQAQPE